MHTSVILILGLGFLSLCFGNILNGVVDVNKLESILVENLKSQDLNSIYYAVRGLRQLNYKIPNICNELKTLKYDEKNIEHVYYLTNAAAITSCSNILSPNILQTPNKILEMKEPTLQDLYYAVYSLKALGKGSIYDKEDALKNLKTLLKKDDSPLNYGYIFLLCEHMGCGAWTLQNTPSVLAAADETDGRVLNFDGGLPVTSLLLSTIFRTHKVMKKPVPLTEEQRYKFAEYLLMRRSVTTAKGAQLLLQAATALSDDEPTPITITIKGKKYVSADSDQIEFSITDLIGRPLRTLKPTDVIAQSGTRLSDDVVVLSKQPLTQKSNQPAIFVLNLNKIKYQYGLYKIALSAGSKTTNVNVAVLGEIQVSSLEVGVGDVDGTSTPKTVTVTYPKQLSEKVKADHLQKLFLKFTVRDKANKAVSIQQPFVRLSRDGEEVIFVAEQDNSKTYKVDLNVNSIGKHFNYKVGDFAVNLMLGDGAISNPIDWKIGQINLSFGKDVKPVESQKRVTNEALPEIRHQFRSAEPRPPRLLSDIFAAASAAPLLLLLIMWARIGINFKRFPLSLSAPLFHVALGGCLALYGMLWLRLTMFETMRYLLPLGLLTFIFGHRLLRTLANEKK